MDIQYYGDETQIGMHNQEFEFEGAEMKANFYHCNANQSKSPTPTTIPRSKSSPFHIPSEPSSEVPFVEGSERMLQCNESLDVTLKDRSRYMGVEKEITLARPDHPNAIDAVQE